MNAMLMQAQSVINAMFVYAAFTEEGYVKVGISRIPQERILAIHGNSPFPVAAAMWAWVGSHDLAREIEKDLAAIWKERNTRGEWYLFDYENDKRSFHDVLNMVFQKHVGRPAEWTRHSPESTRKLRKELLKKKFDARSKRA